MSFVGTRPEATKYVEKYSNEMLATLLLPAGITSEASNCLAVQFALVRGCISQGRYQDLISQLQCLPEQIQKILDDKERIQWFAAKQANARDVFFIGRGLDYAISLEGSLKMKEISYIHSEAYAAGELKHGTISLIEDGTLVIGVLTQFELYEKTISNMVDKPRNLAKSVTGIGVCPHKCRVKFLKVF